MFCVPRTAWLSSVAPAWSSAGVARGVGRHIRGPPRLDGWRRRRSDRPIADCASAGRGARSDRAPRLDRRPRRRSADKPVRRRPSRALGLPSAGALVRGVLLPARGRHFATWDPVLRRSPNRPWRRFGTDALIRVVLGIARDYSAAHPRALPALVGDLSRPRGGDFGRRFGPIGHSTHQNGLDVDVYYPRLDRLPRPPTIPAQVDRALAQDLVDLFVRAGATLVLVGPNVRLSGPENVVKPFPNHDNHLHVRIPNPDRRG
ncbi:MAG: penicillin-insensitive murein endopeptidase [Actinobacteria bacterium]|nr:penicillin-insensitive murein endopeptidase [Actinomycetota bacterium]